MDSFKTRIEGKLNRVHESPQKSYIFKVNHELRKVNKKAYSPVLISIGPYHYERREHDLRFMEQHKCRYLNDMIRRKVEESGGTSRDDILSRCFEILEGHEDRARGYYAEAVPLRKEEFIEMMLVDSCFIIEYFWKCASPEGSEDDPLFQADWIGASLSRDLVLIENQVPFFVLTELLGVIGPRPEPHVIGPWPEPHLPHLVLAAVNSLFVYRHLPTTQRKIALMFALRSISDLIPGGIIKDTLSEERGKLNVESLKNIGHLLDLVRMFMLIDETLLVDSGTTYNQVTQQPQRDQDEVERGLQNNFVLVSLK
ncbi:hypothetical protein SAY87_028472 [Trapa incisa]|uniref:Uncharacterized protein n=1 Tax=Trapa incisa TaxID=236973 RepID=A0AAN7KZV4_9MYRT|nr:hypothetical protein SAY87_028472 [Trapa incisa]